MVTFWDEVRGCGESVALLFVAAAGDGAAPGLAVVGGRVTVVLADGWPEASWERIPDGIAFGSVLVLGTVGDGALGDAHLAPVVSFT